MRITKIQVDNFKSLVGFTLPLSKFNCLVGLNGSGKSTVLQFLDFLSQQMRGDIDQWLIARQWQAKDINSTLNKKSNITFEIELELEAEVDKKKTFIWQASFNRSSLSCTFEKITLNGDVLLKVEDGSFLLGLTVLPMARVPEVAGPISFGYQGSILSQIKLNTLPLELESLRLFFIELNALDMLTPELLREQSQGMSAHLGLGGRKLSTFIYGLGPDRRLKLTEKLKAVYPKLRSLEVSSSRSGLKRLAIVEHFKEKKVITEARHINDGFLRLLAIFAQLSQEQSILLLDEIENGINPELIEYLVDNLVEAVPQVVVTTHSPLILNYLEDDVAEKGVIYLYKNKLGATQAIRLFEIPSMREKLSVMGPGEAYEDTILEKLNDEIVTMSIK